MPERYLSGAESRISNCFLVLTYRYAGNKLSSVQENTLTNLNAESFNSPLATTAESREFFRDRFNADDISNALTKLGNRFGINRQNNIEFPVILDIEQTKIENITSAIDKTRNYFRSDISGSNYKGVVISAVAGQDIGLTVLKQPSVKCNFGFVFRYRTDGQWDYDHFRDNKLILNERNPKVKAITDFNQDEITTDYYDITGDRIRIEFTILDNTLSLPEITSIGNAVDYHVTKGVEGDNIEELERTITLL